MSTDVRFFGGIDWASETHQVCLVAADGKIIGERAFAHGGAGLAEMCDWLVTTSGEEPPKIAVAIEVPHGPIVEILLERTSRSMRSTLNSSTASAIASPSPAPKTTAGTPTCSATRCEPTGIAFAGLQSKTRS
jgi:hypothetical protein